VRKIQDLMQGNRFAELPSSSTIQAAVQLMAEFEQCAVLVTSDGRLEGIITEQDIVRRVVAERLDPDSVTISEVMTRRPDMIDLKESAMKGLQMMEDGGYRHLPVVSDNRIVGLISRLDYVGEEKSELEKERHYWNRIA
jgi:CBS domain-containing protein